MKTKTLQKTKLSSKSLAIVVSLIQAINENNDYRYRVIIKETRNSLNRDNRKYTLDYDVYSSALKMYLSQIEQSARHTALVSL